MNSLRTLVSAIWFLCCCFIIASPAALKSVQYIKIRRRNSHTNASGVYYKTTWRLSCSGILIYESFVWSDASMWRWCMWWWSWIGSRKHFHDLQSCSVYLFRGPPQWCHFTQTAHPQGREPDSPYVQFSECISKGGEIWTTVNSASVLSLHNHTPNWEYKHLLNLWVGISWQNRFNVYIVN